MYLLTSSDLFIWGKNVSIIKTKQKNPQIKNKNLQINPISVPQEETVKDHF